MLPPNFEACKCISLQKLCLILPFILAVIIELCVSNGCTLIQSKRATFPVIIQENVQREFGFMGVDSKCLYSFPRSNAHASM